MGPSQRGPFSRPFVLYAHLWALLWIMALLAFNPRSVFLAVCTATIAACLLVVQASDRGVR